MGKCEECKWLDSCRDDHGFCNTKAEWVGFGDTEDCDDFESKEEVEDAKD